MAVEDWVKNAFAHSLTATAAFAVAIIAVKEARVTAEPDYVQVLQSENALLRRKSDEQLTKLMVAQIKISDLERMGNKTILQVEEGALFTYMDSINRPAWCKRVRYTPELTNPRGEAMFPQFVMADINVAYELKVGISKQRYIGLTDFDVHDFDIASTYYANDVQTWLIKDYVEVREPLWAAPFGTLFRYFAKFYVRVKSGTEYICGIEITPSTASLKEFNEAKKKQKE